MSVEQIVACGVSYVSFCLRNFTVGLLKLLFCARAWSELVLECVDVCGLLFVFVPFLKVLDL